MTDGQTDGQARRVMRLIITLPRPANDRGGK